MKRSTLQNLVRSCIYERWKHRMVMNIHCKISMGIDKITKQYEHECQQKLVKSYMYIAKNKLLLIFVKLHGVLSKTWTLTDRDFTLGPHIVLRTVTADPVKANSVVQARGSAGSSWCYTGWDIKVIDWLIAWCFTPYRERYEKVKLGQWLERYEFKILLHCILYLILVVKNSVGKDSNCFTFSYLYASFTSFYFHIF